MTADRTTALGAPWRRVVWRTLGIAAAGVAAQLPAILLIAWPLRPFDAGGLVVEITGNAAMVGLGVALVLEVYEQCPKQWSPQLVRLALLAGALVVAALAAAAAHASIAVRLELAATPLALRLHLLWINVFLTTLSVMYLTQRRESIEAESRRLQHERQWAIARQRLEISAARASQARLDPRILFESLREAQALYLTAPAKADVLLEQLTTYLRAALANSTADPSPIPTSELPDES
jgi:hypothetical protein